MRQVIKNLSYKEFDSAEELYSDDRRLLDRAKEILAAAYAPYSHYRVGAAVLMENGEVITGSNQENTAFPSGLCAERVAIFSAVSSFPGTSIKAIAISAHADQFLVDMPVPPCGACRQVMIEYENLQNQNIRLILGGETGKVNVIDGIHQLLPLSFSETRLKKK